jgi:hypothetical protein
MRKNQVCRMFLSATFAAAALHPSVLATKPEAYKSIPLAKGQLDETGIAGLLSQRLQKEGNNQHERCAHMKEQLSDIYVQSNVWAPGGSTGWHSHPGHSVVIVTAGTVTNYEGHDPACKPHAYKTGMTFVDPGGAHIHILRNEGTIEAKTIAVQFITANAERRIDVADPGNCHF